MAVEQMLELGCAELRQVKAHFKSLFAHPSVTASEAAFLDGLLGPERRETGWMRAEAAGDLGPWRQQAVSERGDWVADTPRDMVRDYTLETLAAPVAVLVIDETGFLKQGQHSCGVGGQYTGSAGKIANCQVGVFAAYVSDKGCAFIDRQLYLPRDWINAPDRRIVAQEPNSINFVTKSEIGLQMIECALAAGVPLAWVASDTVYGMGRSRCSCVGQARVTCSGLMQRICSPPRSIRQINYPYRGSSQGVCISNCGQDLQNAILHMLETFDD